MTVIAIMNVKGGTGKTTTAVNLAQIFAGDYGRRVLLLDADAQGDATYLLTGDAEGSSSGTYGALCLGGYLADYIQPTRYRGLDLLSGGTDLFYLGLDSSERMTKAMLDVKSTVTEGDQYDLIVIDCPPSFNAVSVAALAAAEMVLVPTTLDAMGIRGAEFLLSQLETIHELTPEASWVRVLPTMYHRSEVCTQARNLMEAMALPVTKIMIRRTDKAVESTFYAQGLGEYSPRSAAGRDYRALSRMLLSEMAPAGAEGGGEDG